MTHAARSLSPASRGGDATPTVRTAAGTRIPEADLHTQRIARQAGRWRALVGERSRMRPETLDAKALSACAFSVHRRASSLAVPSKLVGTSRHQPALRRLSQDPEPWRTLELVALGDELALSHGGHVLGRVQPKHVPWVRPLVPFGLAVYLSRVTGGDGHRLGCNVAFGHVGEALLALAGAASATSGGDGAPSAHGRGALRLVVPEPVVPEPIETGPGVSVRRECEALTGDPDDVVLWRTGGRARASVPHVPRHSPTGIEWGYVGSGPADLARSVLLALTDEGTADALYQRFKSEVVASVPESGGVLRAADVRAWARGRA